MELHLERLGWSRFLLQLATVIIAYLGMSVLPILFFGISPAGVLASVVWSMAVALVVAWLWLRSEGAVGEAWDLSRPASLPKTALVAVGSTGLIVAWFTLGAMLVDAIGLEPPQVEEVIGFVVESPLSYVLWVVLVAWFAAGLGEELLWRGFLLDRLKRLPGIGSRLWLALAIQAVLFGLPHAYQGAGGMIITGVIGLYLGWLRMRSDWNLWACVLAHAAVDTSMMSLAFAEKMEWVQLRP